MSHELLSQSEIENNANEKTLSLALSETLKSESVACISELAEVGLDSILEEGLFKELPIISTAVAIYKIGGSIKDRHNLKKLMVFLNEINNGIADEQKRQDYRQKFISNDKFRNQEIEYLLVLIDRYISYDKPQMLAKLYLAYLDNKINMDVFTEFSEIIDRLMFSDYRCLFEFMCHGGVMIKDNPNVNIASVLRLLSVGFVEQQTGMTWVDIDNPKKQKEDFDYYITDYGKTFIKIVEDELRKIHNEEVKK